MSEVAWKAYEEVHFSDQYILRWVRKGDEYVNKITKEMMEDLKFIVRQQQAELTEAGHMIGVLREHISDLEKGLDSSINLNKAQAERQVKELTDEEILLLTWFKDNPYDIFIEYEKEDLIEFARAILRKAQEK